MKPSDYSSNLEDNICPVCLYIFILPVTMPCEHELCLDCFKKNVEGANFCCPMCRTRISTWARRAAKTKTLVNEDRWKFIQQNFPSQVQSRLDGREEEDEEMRALNVSIKLSEPGEIRNEYEQQLKQLQAQRQEERKKELEASELLIQKLQEEEKRKEDELRMIAMQDEELARKLSRSDVESPLGIEARLRGSSCSSRGAASDGRQSGPNAESMESFINKMRAENNASKSPYPYRCLTPVGTGTGKLCSDKNTAQMLEDHYKRQKIKRDKNLITTQDIANLEEQFKLQRQRPASKTETEPIDIDHLSRGCESNMSMGMRHISTTNLNQNEILDQMSAGLDVSVSVLEPDNNEDEIIVISPSPVLTETRTRSVSQMSRKTSSATSSTSCSYKSAEAENDKPERSISAQSSDSISQELTHFRPIRSCPLTPPRKLPSGRVVEPQLIRTTPRNLLKSGSSMQSETNLSDIDGGSPIMQRRLSELAEERKDKIDTYFFFTSFSKSVKDRNVTFSLKHGKSETNLSDIDGGSPIMQRRLSELAEERKDKISRLSKSTGTDAENRNPQHQKHDTLIRRTSSRHGVEFQDISNSPINTKRKLNLNTEAEESCTNKPKGIIPLVPDFEDNFNNDIVIPVTKSTPVNATKDKLSKSRKGKSRKIAYSDSQCSERVGSPQLSILKWMNKSGDMRTCEQEYLIDSKRDDVDGEKKSNIGVNSKVSGSSQCSESGDSITPRRKRSQRAVRSSQKDDYVYESPRKLSVKKCPDRSSNLDGLCSDGDSEASDNSPQNKKRKLNFDIDDSVSTNSKVKCQEPVFKPKPILKSVKQTKSQSRKNNKPTNKKTKNTKPEKTINDFFRSSDTASCSDTGLASEDSQMMKDRKIAEDLQRQFELEAKFNLNTIRFKGSGEEYSFRQTRKPKNFF